MIETLGNVKHLFNIEAKPGDIVEIIRKSESAGATPYYRVCVADVTL